MELKVGDKVSVRGGGYLNNRIQQFTITRVTAKYAFAKVNDRVEVKFSLNDGVLMPRDKYIDYYIFEINGEPVVEEF